MEPQANDYNARLTQLGVNIMQVALTQVVLGTGTYASVYQGRVLHRNGPPVAVKIIRRTGRDTAPKHLWDRITREVEVWKRLGTHPNIVRLLGVSRATDRESFWLLMPVMSQRDIMRFLNTQEGRVADRCRLIEGIAQGLAHIHSRQLVHGDLKGRNILVDRGIPYLCDFGMTGLVRTAVSTTLERGTPMWMAPERLNPGAFNMQAANARTPESDIFSLGITMYEVFTAQNPYPVSQDNYFDVLNRIQAGERPQHPGEPAVSRGLTRYLWRYMELSWQPAPNSRPPISILLQALDNDEPTPDILLHQQIDPEPPVQAFFTKHFDGSPVLHIGAVPERDRPEERATCHGAVCDVMSGNLTGDGRLVAIKKLRLNKHGPHVYETLAFAVKATAQLSHPNILQFRGVNIFTEARQDRFSLIYDWMPNGNLTAYMENNPLFAPVPLLFDLARGLLYLHRNHVAHGQLMPANILVNEEGHLVLRAFSVAICMASHVNDLSTLATTAVMKYMPPEIISDDESFCGNRSKPGDMYSFGMTAFEIFFRTPPFEINVQRLLREAILSGVRPVIPDEPDAWGRRMPGRVAAFVRRCWHPSAAARPTIEDFHILFPPLSGRA